MNFDSIIFDLDGTLWNALEPICDTWNIILNQYPELNMKMTFEMLNGCMGLPMNEIAARLFPKQSVEMQRKLMDECCEYENEYLAEHGGNLYEGLEEILEYLSKKYSLYIVSNCQDGYIEAFLKAHKLSRYFKDTECWGRTRLPKGESNRILMERNHLENPVYIGDTEGDRQSAQDAGIPFIFARYGFGNADQYDHVIDTLRDLFQIL